MAHMLEVLEQNESIRKREEGQRLEAIDILRGLDKQKVLLPRSSDSMRVLDLKDRAKKLLKELE